jgi:hypothetical protein
MRVAIDEARCVRVAQRLKELNLHTTTYAALEGTLPALEPAQMREYYWFLCALLFDFKGMQATLDGKESQGSELLFALARREVALDPQAFAALRMAKITTQQFNTIFSAERDASCPSISRGAERARLLRETAQALQQRYDGALDKLLAESEGYLRRPDGKGVLDVFSMLPGYYDPHLKKAFVLLKIWQRLGLWEAKDQQNLFIAVDYHLLRVALRSGIVQVQDEALAQRLRNQAPSTPEEEEAIRAPVKLAYKRIEELSGLDVFTLDEIFWTLGRSCCHYARPARCAECDFSHCSVRLSFTYDCTGCCPLADACEGSTDPAQRALFEPMLETMYY